MSLTREQIEDLRRELYDNAALPSWPDLDALCDLALSALDAAIDAAMANKEGR